MNVNVLLAKQDRIRLVFKIYYFFVCMCVSLCKYILEVCRCPGRPEEGVVCYMFAGGHGSQRRMLGPWNYNYRWFWATCCGWQVIQFKVRVRHFETYGPAKSLTIPLTWDFCLVGFLIGGRGGLFGWLVLALVSVCSCVPMSVSRDIGFPWNWSYRQLGDIWYGY